MQRLLLGVSLLALPNAALGQTSRLRPTSPLRSNSSSSRSDSQGKVLLLVRREQDELLIPQLRVELRHTPFHILELRLDDRFANRESLAILAREQSASAAIRIDLGRERVELWISRAEGDVSDSLVIAIDSLEPRIEALRIAEALRAHGLDLGPSPGQAVPGPSMSIPEEPPTPTATEPGGPIQPPAATATAPAKPKPSTQAPIAAKARLDGTQPHHLPPRAIAQPRREGLWGGAGMGTTLSLGGLVPTVNLSSRIGYDWNNHWTLAAFGNLPLIAQQTAGLEGTTKVQIRSLGLAVTHSVYVSRRTTIAAGFGSASHWVSLRGLANSGYEGKAESHALFSTFAVGSFVVPVSDRFRLMWHVLAGATWSELKIQMGDATRARWGQPLAEASMLLGYTL